MLIDSYYIMLVLPAIIISMFAQAKVQSTFSKYSKVFSHRGITGRETAETILRENGIYDVNVQSTAGSLTDNFNPINKTVNLSQPVYNVSSVAAIGVAAHETGHAIQHNTGYFPIKMRNAILPVANIGANAAMPLAILGIVMGFPTLVNIGIILFSAVVLFQLVTLPVEFNASARALKILKNGYVLTEDEMKGAKEVLTAAALTYVAAMLTSLMSLIRLVLISRNRD